MGSREEGSLTSAASTALVARQSSRVRGWGTGSRRCRGGRPLGRRRSGRASSRARAGGWPRLLRRGAASPDQDDAVGAALVDQESAVAGRAHAADDPGIDAARGIGRRHQGHRSRSAPATPPDGRAPAQGFPRSHGPSKPMVDANWLTLGCWHACASFQGRAAHEARDERRALRSRAGTNTVMRPRVLCPARPPVQGEAYCVAARGRVTRMMRLVLLWWISRLPSRVGRMWRMIPA